KRVRGARRDGKSSIATRLVCGECLFHRGYCALRLHPLRRRRRVRTGALSRSAKMACARGGGAGPYPAFRSLVVASVQLRPYTNRRSRRRRASSFPALPPENKTNPVQEG